MNENDEGAVLREELIRKYFADGYSYFDIIATLNSRHSIQISLRQLKRLLKRYGLFRRKLKTPINTLLEVIKEELKGSSSCFGYRYMHQLLIRKGYVTDRESVRLVLKALNPEAVLLRQNHRLQRRVYHCPGPNWSWHIDGYDKLKPFGFCIHGCIDGFSRKILWMRVSLSNNDPAIVASYYLETLALLNIVPRCIRADRGSENVNIGGIQRYLRRNHEDSQSRINSFRYGTSTANQRIESWWSQLRKTKMDWWINYFKDLRHRNILDTSLSIHLQAIRFCYIGVIQKELDNFMDIWNNHRIRKVQNSECPGGKPNVLFHTPDMHGGRQGGLPIREEEIVLATEFVRSPPLFGCSDEFVQNAFTIINSNGLTYPANVAEAESLFTRILNELGEQ